MSKAVGAARAVDGILVPPVDGILAGGVHGDVEQPATQPHQVVTVGEQKRMYLNGETKAVMEHVHKIKQTGQDTSVDQAWKIDWTLCCADTYVKICSVIYLVPKFLFYPVLFLVQLPPVLVCRFYLCCMGTPRDTPNRSGCGFFLLLVALCLTAWPTAFFAVFLLVLDYFVYYVFSIVYCFLTCGWCRYWRSLRALRPYQGGPWILLHLGDVVVAFLGQLYRQGLIEANSMLACMWIFMPWFKYFMNANPWVYALDERFVQQISTSMQDMSLDDIGEAGLTVISRCKQTPKVRRDVDSWRFSPHYPFPPPWRRWAVGMQSGGVDLGRSFFLLVHTTHGFCKNGGSTEQFILSNSVMSPAYRVMLWYNNPYHHLTGWVEASISTGLPAQPEKSRGGEHPMWLVTSHSPFLSRRNAFTGPGHVDHFFDNFLPYFVRLARTLNRGADAARQLDEGVISKDGVSRPAKGHKVPFVPPGNGFAPFYFSKDKIRPPSSVQSESV